MKIKFPIVALTVLSATVAAQADLISLTNSTPIAIPDNDPDGVASGIYLSPDNPNLPANAYVMDLSLAFTIAGNPTAWAGDYTLTLIHVGEDNTSQSLTLFASLPYGNNGFDNVLITSSAGSLSGTSADYSATPITGTFGDVDLSAFQNASAAGEWILKVADNDGINQGALTSWTLHVDVVPEPSGYALIFLGGMMMAGVLIRVGKTQNAKR